MPADIPAGTVSQMGKQGADADLVLRGQEHELGLAVFERDSIVGLDFHRPQRIAAPWDAVPNGSVVTCIYQRAGHQHGDKCGLHAD
jgi:hypothetical protein